MKIKTYILVLFLMFLSINCNTVESEYTLDATSFMPLKIGNRWEYNLNNDQVVANNILVNTIHSDGTLIWGYNEESVGGSGFIWMRHDINMPIGFYAHKDSAVYFYSSYGDSIIYDGTSICKKRILLKTPVEIGNTWEAEKGVVGRIAAKNIESGRGKKPSVTVLVTIDHKTHLDSIWFSRNVGIVKKITHAQETPFYTTYKREVWTLLNYNIK